MSVAGATSGESCGSIHVPPISPKSLVVGISFLAHRGIPLPDFIVGPVVAKASEVEITLSNGMTVRTATLVPPPRLASNIRFYVTELPCPAAPMTLVGRNAAGEIVAHLDRPAGFTIHRASLPRLTCGG